MVCGSSKFLNIENPNGDLRNSIRIFGLIVLVELWQSTLSQCQSGSQHGQAWNFPSMENFFVKNIHTCSPHFLGIDGDAGEGRIDLFGQTGVVEGNKTDAVW